MPTTAEQCEPWLGPGETLGETTQYLSVKGSDRPYDFSLIAVDLNGQPYTDRVFIEVNTTTEPCVLVEGNPLKIELVSGIGSIVFAGLDGDTMRSRNGSPLMLDLQRDVSYRIPAKGTIYWYENEGDEPLILRDTCEGFDLKNEPTLEEFAGIATIMLGRPPEFDHVEEDIV